MTDFDLILSWNKLSLLSNEKINEIFQENFPNLRLFSFSLDWRKSPEYCMKFKGVNGDLLVGWEENDYSTMDAFHSQGQKQLAEYFKENNIPFVLNPTIREGMIT